MKLFKNDIVELNITDMTADGIGVGKSEETGVVFVPDTAVGDRLDVRILKVKKNLSYGKIEKILTPSDNRITPDCPVSTRCGGCVYRHMSYKCELEIKQKKLYDAVTRIGSVDGSLVKDIIGANIDTINSYRNKAQIPVCRDKNGKINMGFYSRHSHRIVDCDCCMLSPSVFNDIAKTVKDFLGLYPDIVYDEHNHTGYIRHLYLRYGEKTGEVMVCFVTNGNSFPHQQDIVDIIVKKYPQVKSILININTQQTNVIMGNKNITLFGKDTITDILCDLRFEISALSFYQVNRTQAQLLYEKARQYADLSDTDTVVDLYCGTGTIGLSMARLCKSVIGVEIIQQAIDNAIQNARINNIDNARFICSDSTGAADRLRAKGVQPNVVIVDPPRKGLTPQLINTISDMQPDRVVYVSCDPATLARDLKMFESNNYSVKEITPVDLFPRTAHVESVALLTRLRKGNTVEVVRKIYKNYYEGGVL